MAHERLQDDRPAYDPEPWEPVATDDERDRWLSAQQKNTVTDLLAWAGGNSAVAKMLAPLKKVA